MWVNFNMHDMVWGWGLGKEPCLGPPRPNTSLSFTPSAVAIPEHLLFLPWAHFLWIPGLCPCRSSVWNTLCFSSPPLTLSTLTGWFPLTPPIDISGAVSSGKLSDTQSETPATNFLSFMSMRKRTWQEGPIPFATPLVFTLTLTTLGSPGGSEVKASACDAGDLGSIPG